MLLKHNIIVFIGKILVFYIYKLIIKVDSAITCARNKALHVEERNSTYIAVFNAICNFLNM